MAFTCTSTLEKFEHSKVWNYHFKIPDSIANEILKEGKRVICEINKGVSFQCGLLSAGDLGYFVNVNATIRKNAKIALYDKVSLQLEIDSSKYGLPLPKVFEELLKQDPVFNKVFHEITLGKQRSLIHMIGNFKSEQKQLEKVIVIRDYLVQVDGKLDYKELQQAFKNNRFK